MYHTSRELDTATEAQVLELQTTLILAGTLEVAAHNSCHVLSRNLPHPSGFHNLRTDGHPY